MATTNHILFEEYLRGTLIGDEKKQLEELLSKNVNEKQEFDLYKTLRKTLSLHIASPSKENELKEHLEKLNKTYASVFQGKEEQLDTQVVTKERPVFLRRIMGMVASLAFLFAALTGIFFYANINYDTQTLAENSFVAPKYVSGDKSADINAFTAEENTYIAALEAYESKEYTTSINLATPLNTSEVRSVREDAQWLLVMNNLALGKESTAMDLLNPIADNPQHNYHVQAKKLRTKLESLLFRIGQLF